MHVAMAWLAHRTSGGGAIPADSQNSGIKAAADKVQKVVSVIAGAQVTTSEEQTDPQVVATFHQLTKVAAKEMNASAAAMLTEPLLPKS